MIRKFGPISQFGDFRSIKAGENAKADLTSLYVQGLYANISLTFQATPNPAAYFISHCFAVLCKFLGVLGKTYFFLKG